ncbi:hypothetical protein D9M73_61490 [compost metagenome]
MRQESHDATMEEANQRKALRMSLADAARPVTVEQGAGGAIRPDTMDNRDVGLPENAALPNQGLTLGAYRVKDKPFTSQADAAAAAEAENAPDAVAKRQGQAYRQAGQPGAALDIEQKQAAITAAQAKQAKMLKEEGVFDALRAFRAGDAGGLVKAFNGGGQYRLEGEPEVVREDREVPGVGTVPTYSAKLRLVGPEGKIIEKQYNSHDLSMQMMPYEKALELQRKGTDSDNKATLIDAKSAALDAKAAAAGAKNAGAPTREERLRYTSLFTDSGRRIQETQKALGALQRDPVFMAGARKEGSPESQQLAELQNTLKQHTEERSMYQGLLAGSQTGDGAPRLADARPKVSGVPAGRDAGRLEILTQEKADIEKRLASGDPRAQGDLDAINREIQGTPGGKPAATPTLAAGQRAAVPATAKSDFRKLWN